MKFKLLFCAIFLSFMLSACGGSGGGSSTGTSSSGFNYNTAPVKIAFDPGNAAIPLPISLPNDANSKLLAGDNSTVKLDAPNASPDTQAFYAAINALKLKGLPANTFLTIPLNSDTKLDLTSLYSNLFLVPFKTGVVSKSGVPPIVAGPSYLTIVQDGKIIKIIFKHPLLSNAQYAVVLKKGIKTADGDLVGRDPAMELMLKQQYATLIAGLGLKTDDILAMSTITTADKTLKLSAFAKLAQGAPISESDFLSYDNITDEFKSILGAASLLPSASSGDTPAKYATLNYFKTGFNSYDITSLSTGPKPVNVPTIILPNGVTDKVVIFQHGLWQQKEAAFALATKFLQAGYPIISMDMPYHGERVSYDNSSFDCNKDGKVETGECYLTSNLVQDRINIYQTVFDLTILLKDLKSGKFDLNGDNVTDNVSTVYYVALSFGSIAGSMFATYNVNNLKKIALTVGGADFSAILDQAMLPDLQNFVKSLGVTKGSAEYYTFLGLVHLMLDPCDPLYNATSVIKDKTIVMSAYGDNIVPNIPNAIFASVMGYPTNPTVITSFDNISSDAGWYQYGGVVDGTPYYVPHAFLLSTDNASSKYGIDFDQTFIDNSMDAVQNQILGFFNK